MSQPSLAEGAKKPKTQSTVGVVQGVRWFLEEPVRARREFCLRDRVKNSLVFMDLPIDVILESHSLLLKYL